MRRRPDADAGHSLDAVLSLRGLVGETGTRDSEDVAFTDGEAARGGRSVGSAAPSWREA